MTNKRSYDAQSKIIALQGANEQDFANLRVTLAQDASQKILKLRQDELDKTNKEVQEQAGLVIRRAGRRGGGNFTTALKNSAASKICFSRPSRRLLKP